MSGLKLRFGCVGDMVLGLIPNVVDLVWPLAFGTCLSLGLELQFDPVLA